VLEFIFDGMFVLVETQVYLILGGTTLGASCATKAYTFRKPSFQACLALISVIAVGALNVLNGTNV
jgi:hypothetical protein